MSTHKKSLLTGLLTALGFGLWAQPMTLGQVMDSIQASHPVSKMYENEIRAMDEAARGARAWMPPQVGLGFFMTPYDVSRWKKSGDMPGMGSVMLSGEQMFPNRKKLDADEAYMMAMSASERRKKDAALHELMHDGMRLYYEWVILEKKRTVLGANEKLLDLMIRTAEIRYKNGLDKINAYYKAKATAGTLHNMRIMLETDIREKKIRLNTLMGRQATTPFSIDTSLVVRPFTNLQADSTLFYENRSDLKAIDADIRLAQLKQQAEEMSLKPQFGVRYENMFGFGGQPMLYNLMGMMRIPMAGWSSRMNKANVESLRWKSAALQSQKAMLLNEYSGMAHDMLNEMGSKQQQLLVYESEILPALRNNFRTMQLAYEQNTGELFMLYDAWEILNMTQMEYLDLLGEMLQLQTNLERLTQRSGNPQQTTQIR